MTIGIIVAMEKEIKKYKELFALELIDKKFSIYKGTYITKNIYITLCGVGKVNSAMITQYLIDKYNVNYIINSGCCGSLTTKVKLMDTIISDYVTYHDFFPIRVMESYIPEKGKITSDRKLIKLASTILNKNNIPFHIGGIASGDCFITDSKMRDDIYNKTKALAVDMESVSIGQVAKLNNVPFLIIRTISDFADGVDEQEEKAADISAMLTQNIISNI